MRIPKLLDGFEYGFSSSSIATASVLLNIGEQREVRKTGESAFGG
jgi:hypothetical protein